MNISLILTAMALCHNNSAQPAYTPELTVPYSAYSSLNFPDPPPLLEENLDSSTQIFSQKPAARDKGTRTQGKDATAHHSYVSPTSSEPHVIRPFMPPALKWSSGHRGVDIALETGNNVLAAGDGVVIYAGKLNDRSVISIEHADGIRTTYEPVSPSVSKGDRVKAGQVIGTLDSGHCGNQSCLHWGAKRGKDNYIDPLSLMQNRQIRLIE